MKNNLKIENYMEKLNVQNILNRGGNFKVSMLKNDCYPYIIINI